MPKSLKLTIPKELTRPAKILFAVPESFFSEKNSNWFVVTALGLAVFVGGMVWFHYYLPAIALIIGSALFYSLSVQETAKAFCAMTEKGITFRGMRYPFNYFKHFSIWLDRFGEGGVLIFSPQNMLKAPLTLRFEGIHYAPIRLFLRHHLPEHLHAPTIISDLVARVIRL